MSTFVGRARTRGQQAAASSSVVNLTYMLPVRARVASMRAFSGASARLRLTAFLLFCVGLFRQMAHENVYELPPTRRFYHMASDSQS